MENTAHPQCNMVIKWQCLQSKASLALLQQEQVQEDIPVYSN